jgi:hypothetical protein
MTLAQAQLLFVVVLLAAIGGATGGCTHGMACRRALPRAMAVSKRTR